MPDIHYNFASGSDSQASGAPYDMSPIFGTGASTASSTSVDLSADSPNLSAVPTDGTAVLWVETSSGRQWGQITAVNDTTKVVTVSSTYDVTATGQTWAIGGKRKTLDTYQQLFDSSLTGGADWAGGWNILLEDDQTISTTLNRVLFNSTMTIRSDVPGVRRTIAQSTSGIAVIDVFASTADTASLIDLKLTNTNPVKTTGTRGLTRSQSGSGGRVQLLNCEIGDETDQLYDGLYGGALAIDCYIHHCVNFGTQSSVRGCVVANNGIGIYSANASVSAYDSFICDNTGDGISFEFQYAQGIIVHHCTIANNGGDGVGYSTGSGGGSGGIFKNNSITGNGTYGVGYAGNKSVFINNNFGTGATANGSGAIAGTAKLEQGSTFTDPMYLDAANGDYRIPSNSPNANAATQSWGGISYRKSIGAADVVQDAGGPVELYYLADFHDHTDMSIGGDRANLENTVPLVDNVSAGNWVQYSGTRWEVNGGRASIPSATTASGGLYANQSFNSCIASFDSKLSDYRITTSLYGHSTNISSGLIFRHDFVNQTYFMLLNRGANDSYLYYYDGVSTGHTSLASVGANVNSRFNVYEVECVGDQISIYRNSALVYTRTDTNSMTATGVGVYNGNTYSGGIVSLVAIHKPGTRLTDHLPIASVGRQPAIPHPLAYN